MRVAINIVSALGIPVTFHCDVRPIPQGQLFALLIFD